MLIGLFVIPSGLRAAHDTLAPLFVELYSVVGLIIGVVLSKKCWMTVGRNTKENIKALVGYPESFMILSDVMILTYNVAMRFTQSSWWRCIKTKPPDPVPAVIGSVRCSIFKRHQAKKRLTDPIILGLIAAGTIAAQEMPTFSLRSTNKLRKRLHKYSDVHGYLQTHKLKPEGADLDLLRHVLAEEPSGLLSVDDSTLLVIDCGASNTTTYDENDFKPETLQLYKEGEKSPIQGIAGTLPIRGQGIISLQVIGTNGEVVDIETKAYYIPELKTKLFSPQAYFNERNDKSELIITRSNALMRLVGSNEEEVSEVEFHYDQQTRLPIMRAYRNALTTARALALSACLTDERNQNLTAAQKLLLRWHFKMGHAGFALVKWLG